MCQILIPMKLQSSLLVLGPEVNIAFSATLCMLSIPPITYSLISLPEEEVYKQMWRACLRFWVLRAVNINFAVLWDVTPCSLVNSDMHVGERAVSIYHTYLQHCTTSSAEVGNNMEVLCEISSVRCYIMLLRCTCFLLDFLLKFRQYTLFP